MSYLDADAARSGNFRDLRDLDDLYDDLVARSACDYCGAEVKPDPEDDDHFVHAETGRFFCLDEEDEADPTHADAQDYPDEDELEVLAAITELRDEIGEQAFRDGGAMIIDSEWVEYAQQTAEDVGMIDTDSAMINYVDWDRWAEALAQDYTGVTFLGNDYYVQPY